MEFMSQRLQPPPFRKLCSHSDYSTFHAETSVCFICVCVCVCEFVLLLVTAHIKTGSPITLLSSNMSSWGFPGGAVVWSLPANAGDTGSSPGLGGSHMPRSSWAREPQLLNLRVWSLCSATREAAIVRDPRTAMKSGPHLPQLEKVLAQKRRPNTAKNK